MSVVLSEHLPLLASTPDGIQKLRELILRLAIEGRITGSDTSVWKRTTLGDVGEWGSGGTPLKAHSDYYGGTIPWLVIGDLNDGLVTAAETHITEKGLANSSAKLVPVGTLLIAMYGSIGKLGIAGIECATNQAIAHCKVNSAIAECRFLFYFVRAIRGQLLSSGQGLAQQNISQKLLKATPIRLPPLAEQHRIVAKVDELMALCDRLEAEQADGANAHARLVETLLGTLTQSTDAADLAANWQRLAEHFDTLFTTEASIDALKETVLQLAVMGKLVRQEPNDEPACQTFSGLKPLLKEQDNLSSSQPAQWVSCSYRSLTSLVTSGSRGWKDFYSDSGAIFIRTQDIKTDRLVLDDVAFVNLPKTTEGMRSQVMQHDILITITGANVTKAARVESKIPEAYISQHIALTRPRWPAMSRWLHLCFTSRGSARGALEQLAYGAKPGLNLSNIRDLILPIPPLAEQHRIVAKVDELMALCESLNADLAVVRQRHAALADTLIESALEAA